MHTNQEIAADHLAHALALAADPEYVPDLRYERVGIGALHIVGIVHKKGNRNIFLRVDALVQVI